MRLTRDVIAKILVQNEGFKYSPPTYSGKNFSESRVYTIINGKLYVRSKSNSSWSNSRESNEWEASEEETHRFLYKYLTKFNLTGIE